MNEVSKSDNNYLTNYNQFLLYFSECKLSRILTIKQATYLKVILSKKD